MPIDWGDELVRRGRGKEGRGNKARGEGEGV